MASDLNPSMYQNSLPQMPLGPLTGFLSGMNQDLANQATQRNFEADDLQKILTKLKIQEDQGTLQSKIDKANYEGAKATTDTGLLPDYAAAQKATYGAQTATAGLQQTTADVQQKLAAGPLYVQMAEEAKQRWGGQANPMDPNFQQWYQGWYDKLSKYAPDMPSMASTGDLQHLINNKAPQAAAFMQNVQANAAAQVQSVPQQQKLAGINAEIQGKHADVATEAASREEAARIAAQAHVKGAEVSAQGGVDRVRMQLEAAKSANSALTAQIAYFKKLPPQERAAFVPTLIQSAVMAANLRPDVVEQRKLALYTGGDMSAIDNTVKQNALDFLRTDPAFREAEQVAGGAAAGGMGGVPPSNAPQSFTKTPDTPRTFTLSKTQGLPSDLKPGDIVNGHKYLGGPSTNPKSWEQ